MEETEEQQSHARSLAPLLAFPGHNSPVSAGIRDARGSPTLVAIPGSSLMGKKLPNQDYPSIWEYCPRQTRRAEKIVLETCRARHDWVSCGMRMATDGFRNPGFL